MYDNVMSMLGVAVAMWATSLGCGLALERVAGRRLPNGLVLALGVCVGIVVVYPTYALGLGDAAAIVVLAVIGIAGLGFADGGLRARLNPGWPGLTGLATYILFILPLLGAGHWTWAGYNLDNDTAFEFLLAQHLQVYGTHLGALPLSNAREFVQSYLGSGYPLGTHAQLATMSGLLGAPVAVLYQGYIAALAAFAAIALAALVTPIAGARGAALLGFAAVGANLTYQYAMQGQIKEIGTLAAVCATFAVGREAMMLRERGAGRAALLLAFPLAAVLDTYNAAALPYVGASVALLAVCLLIARRVRPSLRWLRPSIGGAVLTGLLALPALATIETFYAVATTVQARSTGPGASPQLGQLLRPLPLSQLSGVWLSGDYRTPIGPEPAALITSIAAAIVLLLVIAGVAWPLWRRRETAPLLAVGTMGLVLAVVYPRVSPYADGKLMAIASPIVVLVAGVALLAIPARRAVARHAGIALACLLTLGVVVSDVLAYHNDGIGPHALSTDMMTLGHALRDRGLVDWNEADEYAKYFADGAQIDQPFEPYTPLQVKLRYPGNFLDHYYDLDDQKLSFVERFATIVTRRSPAASRPPANYRVLTSDAHYIVWARTARPHVIAHLSEQQAQAAAAPVRCDDLRALVAGAPGGSRLVVATAPATVQFSTLLAADRSIGWGLNPVEPDTLVTTSPGHASGIVRVALGGRYAVWVQGSFPARLDLEVDGHPAGHVQGAQSLGQWTRAATVSLAAGAHSLRIVRPAGRAHFGPGDGATGTLGNVALAAQTPETLRTVPLGDWRSLCGRTVDWVEVVR